MTEEQIRAHRAGRALSSFGWLGVLFLPVFIVVKMSPSFRFGPGEIAGTVVLVLFVSAFLLIGHHVKKNGNFAKVLAAVASVLILPLIPIGTLVGGVTLYHLMRGVLAKK